MTYTVLARDPQSGLIGGATASRSLAAGNAVLMLRPGVGVVASQAWTNRALRTVLLDALERGGVASEALARIPEVDEHPELRQAALLPEAGTPAAYSGAGITAWAGDIACADAVYAGNLLAGEEVLDAMRGAMERSTAPSVAASASAAASVSNARSVAAAAFARRLVEALIAGEERGGDARGRQSAAVVVGTMGADADTVVDLRVDDHVDPLAELTRLVDLRAAALSARTE